MLCVNTQVRKRFQMIKTYSELAEFKSFEDRFQYLKLGGGVGVDTFGFDRYLNQQFYASSEWQHARREVILRDRGCDLGIDGYEIRYKLLVHHINPMVPADILDREPWIFDPEFLITTTHNTHNAIHYGDDSLIPKVVAERQPNDTKLW